MNIEINDYKLISKIIICCILVFLFCWLGYNLAYTEMLYKDYCNLQKEYDTLINKYIENEK